MAAGSPTKAWCLAAGALGLAVLVAAAAGGALLLRGGISARAEPSRAEARLARALRSWAIPSDARDARNPVPAGPAAISAGLAHFADHCAVCHGNDGSGQTPVGQGLYPKPPDLRAERTQLLSDGELFYIIENGVRLTAMPAWGGGERDRRESWQLVHFIRHLPQLTDEDKAEMKKLNPKSPDELREEQEEEAFLNGEETHEKPISHHHR